MWTWVSQFSLSFLPPLSLKESLWVRCPASSLQQCQSMEGDAKHWPWWVAHDLILSSSTTGLLREGTLLPLCQLSDASSQEKRLNYFIACRIWSAYVCFDLIHAFLLPVEHSPHRKSQITLLYYMLPPQYLPSPYLILAVYIISSYLSSSCCLVLSSVLLYSAL